MYVFSVLSKDSLSPQWGEGRVRGERGSCAWKRENAHLTPALSPLKGGEGAFQVLLTEYSSTDAKYVPPLRGEGIRRVALKTDKFMLHMQHKLVHKARGSIFPDSLQAASVLRS